MRRSSTARLWADRMRRFEADDRTVTQFYLDEGVSQPSFYQWRRKLKERSVGADEHRPIGTARFLPVALPTASPTGDDIDPAGSITTIELPGGVRIRVEVPAADGFNAADIHRGDTGVRP